MIHRVVYLGLVFLVEASAPSSGSPSIGDLAIVTARHDCSDEGVLTVEAKSLPGAQSVGTMTGNEETIHLRVKQGQYYIKVTKGRCAATFIAAVFGGVTRTLAVALDSNTKNDISDTYVVASDAIMVLLPTRGMFISAAMDGKPLSVFADGQTSFIDSVPRGELVISAGGANFRDSVRISIQASDKLYTVQFDDKRSPQVTPLL